MVLFPFIYCWMRTIQTTLVKYDVQFHSHRTQILPNNITIDQRVCIVGRWHYQQLEFFSRMGVRALLFVLFISNYVVVNLRVCVLCTTVSSLFSLPLEIWFILNHSRGHPRGWNRSIFFSLSRIPLIYQRFDPS